MIDIVLLVLRTLNQLLTAGIAITAFSLLLYALTFNLKDRVARSFILIMVWVVIVFACDALGSVVASLPEMEFWLQLQWVGIVFIPATYVQFADALLATTGQPSRGKRWLLIRLTYLASLGFLVTLPLSLLVGKLVQNVAPAPHLERTWLTWVFTAYYLVSMLLAGSLFIRAYNRTVAKASRRRMGYLLVGALSPALGCYPYLLFGSGIAMRHPIVFWVTAVFSNIWVSILLIVMAYAVAFFGVPWPDRVIKRRLFKWLMRGPVTASTVLAVVTLVRRAGEYYGFAYTAAVPLVMVGLILIFEHIITLVAPLGERILFQGSDRRELELLQRLEDHLLTTGDLHQFLESVLSAVCDRLQTCSAFIVALESQGIELLVTVGDQTLLEKEGISQEFLERISEAEGTKSLFLWGEYWLVALYTQKSLADEMVGLMGIKRSHDQEMELEQNEPFWALVQRAAQALEDRRSQRQLINSLEVLAPDVEMIQRLRAAARYNGGVSLTEGLSDTEDNGDITTWVKDALTHYWGGPKLTNSPLLDLKIVQQAQEAHEGNPTNALRAILRRAVDKIRPEGERRFTGEWILYNILEMKFMEGRKVREVAIRLAMSEADLYRKQRVAIEAVANAILDMEREVYQEPLPILEINTSLHSEIKGGLNGN
ncbi:MAG: hypothetical protein JW908_13815 [Anaerolineales bacterium]|nr:hypothetical protein [Anaerolineales bacterium]